MTTESITSQSRCILIVEDDRDIRTLLRNLFEHEGFQVFTAENGQIALDKLKDGVHPQVILLDLIMPIMDAVGFRKIQEMDPAIADIPVIVMSADHALEIKGLRLGLNRSVQKPIDIDKLIQTVYRVLDSSVEVT